MTTVLQLDSSALGTASASRTLTAAIIDTLRTTGQADQVVYRDLAAQPIGHLDGEILGSLRPVEGVTPSASVQAELALNDTLIAELFAADIVVIGAPMYNLLIPSQLKTWIDRVLQAGRTFRYSSAGPEGLVVGKRAIIASSRGGAYAGVQFEAALDHQEAYLKAVLAFIGLTDVRIIRAEGLAMGPDARQKGMETALAELQTLSA